MKIGYKHIIINGLAMVLIMAVLLPSVVKFGHIFENHKHEVCVNQDTTHFHSLDLDCEFYKFKLNNALSFLRFDEGIISVANNFKLLFTYYQSLHTCSIEHIVLRGPPYTFRC